MGEEADMTDLEGRMKWRDHETWFRVVGELDPGASQMPVVICHGGPGAAHDYCEPIADLSRSGRACVLYDQLGCGKSQLQDRKSTRLNSSHSQISYAVFC